MSNENQDIEKEWARIKEILESREYKRTESSVFTAKFGSESTKGFYGIFKNQCQDISLHIEIGNNRYIEPDRI